jgi:hypothetical protein
MFNMPTSGPLSPIVSLERRKLEQQGIPPGQEQQGSAAKGSPISGDLAQLIQLNRMIQQQGAMQQQANPAPSTVAQDLMQRAGQQMQPQMQQMPPQMDPRQQGIAQLPQEAVGNGMAAGGIVAFDEGGLAGGLLDPGYGQDNVLIEELRKRANAEMEAKRQATLKAVAQRNAVSDKRQGLKDLVPTLSAPKETMPSELEMALSKANVEATKNPEWYAAQRKKMEEESGLAGIWKKQQEEQERLKAQNNPAARNKAFWDNLSEQLAGQIGQRGVPLSSRLAQMVGAYGTARSATNKETKKLEAELNKASTDLQEKQAMYRMTGAAADRDAVAKAQKERGALALEVEKAKQLEKKQLADEAREDRRDKQSTRELDLRAARDQREADHQQKMLDITSGKEPISRATSLMTSYNNEARALVDVIKAPETDPEARKDANAALVDVRRRLNEVQSVLRQGLPGMSATAPAPVKAPTVKWGALK